MKPSVLFFLQCKYRWIWLKTFHPENDRLKFSTVLQDATVLQIKRHYVLYCAILQVTWGNFGVYPRHRKWMRTLFLIYSHNIDLCMQLVINHFRRWMRIQYRSHFFAGSVAIGQFEPYPDPIDCMTVKKTSSSKPSSWEARLHRRGCRTDVRRNQPLFGYVTYR